MASPTFNSLTLFDSIDAGGNYSEGVLWVPEYSKIRQAIHFNGGDGLRYLTHGYADRAWIFRGLISANSISGLYTIFSAIEDAIDEADSDDSTYHPLVDSFGNAFDLAQIHHFVCSDIHIAQHNDGNTGFTSTVQVSGIIKGMQHDGAGCIMAQSYLVYLGEVYSDETTKAGTATVGATYTLAEWLAPTHISIGTNGEIGEARIMGNKHPDIGACLVSLHQAIQIRESGEDGEMIFQGVVVKKHLSSSGDGEQFDLVCYNTGDFLLYRIALHGQYRRNHAFEQAYFTAGPADGAQGITLDQLVLIDTPLIFNPDGAPNMSPEQYFNSDDPNSNTISIFDAPYRKQVNSDGDPIVSVAWKLKDAVTYLLNIYPVSWAIDPASFTDTAMGVFDTHGSPEISNVNLEGKPLSLALKELLEPHNYGYWIDPVPSGEPIRFHIHFFYRGSGESVTVTLPERDSNDLTDANVIHYDLLYDACSVVNCVTGIGDQKVFTTLAHTVPPAGGTPCLKLVPAWAHDDLVFVADDNNAGRINSYAKQFRRDYAHPDLLTTFTGEGAHTAYGVGRIWMVNAGEAPAENLEDLKVDLADGSRTQCSVDSRRFEKPELYVTSSVGGLIQQEEVQVEMSFDSGNHWNIVDKSYYKVLSEGMGIVFIEPRLERLGTKFDHIDGVARSTYWQCLYDMLYAGTPIANKLQIRVLCAVKSDERLVKNLPNASDSVPLVIERVFDNPGFKKNVFNSHAYDSLYYTSFPPEKLDQDDTDGLHDAVAQQIKQSDRLLLSGKVVVILGAFNQYKPGQQLTSIVNRIATLDPAPTIIRVVYDLQANHVELILDNHRVASILRNKPLNNESTAKKYGAEQTSALPSGAGHHVDHLPGVAKDRKFQRSTAGESGGEEDETFE